MRSFLTASTGLVLCFGLAIAESPPMEVPPAPKISAAKAVELADAYVAKHFPEDAGLYCQSTYLHEAGMRPVRAHQHWAMLYRRAGAKRRSDAKSNKEAFGDFHVYVAMDGKVSHEP